MELISVVREHFAYFNVAARTAAFRTLVGHEGLQNKKGGLRTLKVCVLCGCVIKMPDVLLLGMAELNIL